MVFEQEFGLGAEVVEASIKAILNLVSSKVAGKVTNKITGEINEIKRQIKEREEICDLVRQEVVDLENLKKEQQS